MPIDAPHHAGTRPPTRETELADPAVAAAIEALWSREGRFGRIDGVGGVSLAYAAFRQPSPADERGAIVVVSGRTESLLKYRELTYDLWRAGHSVYLYDHRGQGLSGRESVLGQPAAAWQRGHVGRFDDYVDDLRRFVRAQVLPAGHRHPLLLAHSMGSAVAALFLASHGPEAAIFRAAALASPMFAFGRVSSGIVSPVGLACGGVALLRAVGLGHRSALPRAGWRATAFDANPYTGSRLRFERWQATFDEAPATRLGAPTFGWLAESCMAARRARDGAGAIRVPVLLAVAGADSIVHATGADRFWAKLRAPAGAAGHARIDVPAARHELLIEADAARSATLTAVLDFYAERTGTA